MKFDEAIEHFRNNTDISGTAVFLDDVEDTLKELRQEYAPTVDMTAKEKEYFLSIATSSVTFTNFYEQVLKQSTNIKFGVQTTPELYKHLPENELMQAWLHQDTIKVKGD